MPDPYTDSNIALTPVPPPSAPEGGLFPGQTPDQFSTGADYKANRGVAPLANAINGGALPVTPGLAPNFEQNAQRVTKLIDPTPDPKLVAQLNAADAQVLRADQQQKIAEAEGKDRAYGSFQRSASEALANYRQEMARSPLPAFVPTKETAGDIATLASLVGVVGLMAGRGKGLQPGLAALDSMTGMLKGWQQGRADLYEREYNNFKANFQRIQQAHREYQNELSTAFKVSEVDLNKGLAEANLAAVKAGDSVMQAAIKQGSLNRALEISKGQKQASAKAAELVMQLEAKQAARLGITPYDDQTLRSMAEQYLAGDKSVLQGLGAGNVGAMNRFALRQMISTVMQERGMSGADVAAQLAQFAGLTAGMRTIGTRSANVELAVNEAVKMRPIVERASEAVDRSDMRLIALTENGFAAQTGDEKIVQFTAALNTYVNVYSRAVSPSGVPTNQIREHAYDMLNTGMSKGQIKAVLNTLDQEMDAALESPAAAFSIFKGRITGQPEPDQKPGGKTKYTVGQVLDVGGKKVRVTGGDLSGDPDVEVVQ